MARLRSSVSASVTAPRTNAEVQVPLNRLSESARGENKKQEAEDPETVLSNLKGHVSVKNGIATLSNVSFSAPGTLAQIRGTYNLLDKTVNLQGVLRTNGKLSDTTSGFKALVLKAELQETVEELQGQIDDIGEIIGVEEEEDEDETGNGEDQD